MNRPCKVLGVGLLTLTMTLLTGGCGSQPQYGQVEGTVTLEDAPVKQVRVQFMPDPEKGTQGPSSTAITDRQGRYRLRYHDSRTLKEVDGVVIGWHRVTLEDMSRPATPQGEEALPSQVPSQYSSARKTPFRFEVKPGEQTLDLPLEPEPKLEKPKDDKDRPKDMKK